ncbi:MAG: hypothetical protein JEZ07_05955 [Phycisphaerae bacterium]|nr:hypothetical protein [Phycisphaerae bacterium]
MDFLVWQVATTASNPHGTRYGGWIDTGLTWWLSSANNVWPSNPYTVVTVYGNKSKVPWSNANGAKFIGNSLRDYKQVGLSISKPRTSAGGSPSGGHAIAAWGDSGSVANNQTSNPAAIIVADSDRDNGGDFQTYTYDSYTNPNPGGFDEGNGWYLNFSANHWFIKHIATLTPTDHPIVASDGPTQMVVGSYKIHQNDLEAASDLHYTAWTDYNILAYHTDIDWPTNELPAITESNDHVPGLTRSDIHADWDLTDTPVPFNKDVTITTEFILQNWNGIHYDDVYFTYPGGEDTKFVQLPNVGSMGVDVRVDNYDERERLLADDFLCIQRGPITKVFLWGSWVYDTEKEDPGKVNKFHLTIYSDDPVGDDPKNPDDDPDNETSKPLKLLWEGDFDDFASEVYGVPAYEETFWDPFTSAPLAWDRRVWQYEIDIPESMAFVQQGSRSNPLVYWLGVSAEIDGQRAPRFGWHTTSVNNHWNDKAVAWKDDFVKTDEFDYWEDQESHQYKTDGSVEHGVYQCETDSLRIGVGDSGSFAQFTATVKEGTDQVKLRYQIPWSGSTTGAALYVDGVGFGTLSGGSCQWQELILPKMAEHTIDGQIDIKLVDEQEGYSGDIQIAYMEVFSIDKQWVALSYPEGHEMQYYPVDLAFAVVTPTTEPGILMPSFGWNIVTAAVENPNLPDISGGYVIGSFDIFNEAGPSTHMGEYRFVHQYPHTQDPERHTFSIAGPKQGGEFVAKNFKFGHSYGKPGPEELWQFSDWMTTHDEAVFLGGGEPVAVQLDWNGRLPYPASETIPAHLLPDPLDCTVYLEADINEDCYVDIHDFGILASQWLQSTN